MSARQGGRLSGSEVQSRRSLRGINIKAAGAPGEGGRRGVYRKFREEDSGDTNQGEHPRKEESRLGLK